MASILKMAVFSILVAMFAACGKGDSQRLLGKWSGVDRNDNNQILIFHDNNSVTWIVAETGTLNVRYRFDASVVPYHLDLMGFVGPPLENKTLFGIAEFTGPNELRFDCDAGPSSAPGTDFRPKKFTNDSVLYRRID